MKYLWVRVIIYRANSDHDGEKSSAKRKKILWPDNPLKPKPKEIKEG